MRPPTIPLIVCNVLYTSTYVLYVLKETEGGRLFQSLSQQKKIVRVEARGQKSPDRMKQKQVAPKEREREGVASSHIYYNIYAIVV